MEVNVDINCPPRPIFLNWANLTTIWLPLIVNYGHWSNYPCQLIISTSWSADDETAEVPGDDYQHYLSKIYGVASFPCPQNTHHTEADADADADADAEADADADADEEDVKVHCASDDIGKCRADEVDDCSQIHWKLLKSWPARSIPSDRRASYRVLLPTKRPIPKRSNTKKDQYQSGSIPSEKRAHTKWYFPQKGPIPKQVW